MSSAAPSRRIERLYPDDADIDPEIAEQVGQEILRQRLEPAAWARALAASGGKKQDALAAYARIRMQQVAAHRRLRRAKSQSFEARRLTTCLGIKTVQDLLQRSNRGGQLNLLKPQLSYIWLAILMLGCSGSVASLGRLLGGFLPESISAWLPGIALLSGHHGLLRLPGVWREIDRPHLAGCDPESERRRSCRGRAARHTYVRSRNDLHQAAAGEAKAFARSRSRWDSPCDRLDPRRT
jgi:hypothetical protein